MIPSGHLRGSLQPRQRSLQVTEKEKITNCSALRCRTKQPFGWVLAAAVALRLITLGEAALAADPPPKPPEAAPAPVPPPAPVDSPPAAGPPATGQAPAPAEGAAPPPAPTDSPTGGPEPVPALEAMPALPELPALPEAPPPPARRMKSLRISTGAAPTAVDLGSEVAINEVGRGDNYNDDATESVNKGWWFSLKGYVRMPMRIGLGPRDDRQPGLQLHSPPRVPGQNSSDWTYLALASNPVVNMYLTVGNPRLSASVIMAANTAEDAGFQDLDQVGGITQAYLTLKFPDAFGTRGGVALTAGSFSMRWGNAGPGERSSGYYGSYVFGRTHLAGEDLTADIDLNDRFELVLEHGIGAFIEPVPFDPGQLKNGFLPTATDRQGSTFVNHAHAMLAFDDWLRVGAHLLNCWSPNDTSPIPIGGQPRMNVYGGDVHVDGLGVGSGYIGVSRVTANNVTLLAPALQVMHGTSGVGFRNTFFIRKDPVTNRTPSNDQGTVDSIVFQYIVRLGKLLGRSPIGRDTTLALFGMYSHVRSVPLVNAQGHPTNSELDINDHRLKVGGEVEVAAHKYFNFGVRGDYVQMNLTDRSPSEQNLSPGGTDTFWALSPRLLIHTNWKSKEYVIVDYTHYFLGPRTYPGSPYSTILKADPHMLSITALLSF